MNCLFSLCLSLFLCTQAYANTGESIVKQYCGTCHGLGLAGAPKIHSKDWDPRLKKGLNALLKNAIQGFNAMPAKGTCASCTEAELKAAIIFMSH